ncbi:MAG TPA: carbohydrate kinase family protein [Thermomonospora sp.]|nr:carbohydrate kinase family protein [Thermomonospora sp.]
MTPRIVVAGVASLYLTVQVDGFPLRYAPYVRPGWAASAVAGAGVHVARALRALGDDVRLCTVVGEDPAGSLIRRELDRDGLLGPGTVASAASSLGLVLVDPAGRRMGMPHLAPADAAEYPFEVLAEQARDADLLVLTNTRFVRPLVGRAADLGVPIAVDVHLVRDLAGEYNRPWLDVASVVFCSAEMLPRPPRAWVAEVFRRCPRCTAVGVGMGSRGALVGSRDGRLVHVPAVAPRGVVNTSGAGDALFAAFLHGWVRGDGPVTALRTAVLHAGWKVGHRLPALAAPPPDGAATASRRCAARSAPRTIACSVYSQESR